MILIELPGHVCRDDENSGLKVPALLMLVSEYSCYRAHNCDIQSNNTFLCTTNTKYEFNNNLNFVHLCGQGKDVHTLQLSQADLPQLLHCVASQHHWLNLICPLPCPPASLCSTSCSLPYFRASDACRCHSPAATGLRGFSPFITFTQMFSGG